MYYSYAAVLLVAKASGLVDCKGVGAQINKQLFFCHGFGFRGFVKGCLVIAVILESSGWLPKSPKQLWVMPESS